MTEELVGQQTSGKSLKLDGRSGMLNLALKGWKFTVRRDYDAAEERMDMGENMDLLDAFP